jgi:hypothetical protein
VKGAPEIGAELDDAVHRDQPETGMNRPISTSIMTPPPTPKAAGDRRGEDAGGDQKHRDSRRNGIGQDRRQIQDQAAPPVSVGAPGSVNWPVSR